MSSPTTKPWRGLERIKCTQMPHNTDAKHNPIPGVIKTFDSESGSFYFLEGRHWWKISVQKAVDNFMNIIPARNRTSIVNSGASSTNNEEWIQFVEKVQLKYGEMVKKEVCVLMILHDVTHYLYLFVYV